MEAVKQRLKYMEDEEGRIHQARHSALRLRVLENEAIKQKRQEEDEEYYQMLKDIEQAEDVNSYYIDSKM